MLGSFVLGSSLVWAPLGLIGVGLFCRTGVYDSDRSDHMTSATLKGGRLGVAGEASGSQQPAESSIINISAFLCFTCLAEVRACRPVRQASSEHPRSILSLAALHAPGSLRYSGQTYFNFVKGPLVHGALSALDEGGPTKLISTHTQRVAPWKTRSEQVQLGEAESCERNGPNKKVSLSLSLSLLIRLLRLVTQCLTQFGYLELEVAGRREQWSDRSPGSCALNELSSRRFPPMIRYVLVTQKPFVWLLHSVLLLCMCVCVCVSVRCAGCFLKGASPSAPFMFRFHRCINAKSAAVICC